MKLWRIESIRFYESQLKEPIEAETREEAIQKLQQLSLFEFILEEYPETATLPPP